MRRAEVRAGCHRGHIRGDREQEPADAARALDGPIKSATGVLLASICVMMSRVESTSPPGVRSVKTTRVAPARSAQSIVAIMYSAETG